MSFTEPIAAYLASSIACELAAGAAEREEWVVCEGPGR